MWNNNPAILPDWRTRPEHAVAAADKRASAHPDSPEAKGGACIGLRGGGDISPLIA